MNWDAIGTIAELIGAAGVILSLVYVGRQLNQSKLERIQLGYLFTALSNQLHMGFEQWKEGLISREELEDYMGPAMGILAFPYLRSVWPILKPGYPVDFQEWFETRYVDAVDS